ncbi:hypothetical protein COCON_G00217580 [Conger conger]|uniref:CRIB domain-containing protein n=1 Tax=Conger conger TaxID=82655 RepID=A0A9Q1CYA6_CONCO|nr:hypothetical protein COCON_G00217580 [Conger conger]
MTELWICFTCCIAEQPQPKRRRRIDRSMIGEPTNFVHTTHVGSGDMAMGVRAAGPAGTSQVDSLQDKMKSKGGYGNGATENAPQ